MKCISTHVSYPMDSGVVVTVGVPLYPVIGTGISTITASSDSSATSLLTANVAVEK